MPETLIAHCGACVGRMIMRQTAEGVWFVCQTCYLETSMRPTAAEAGEDVVWVTLAQEQDYESQTVDHRR
jgi:ssDNA-binding Zn-finger/Zn-ribbon topoisomerase 1